MIYPATLLNSPISSNNFLAEILEFSVYSIMSSTVIKFYFFPIWIPFISFLCLTAVAQTFSTMLNRSG